MAREPPNEDCLLSQEKDAFAHALRKIRNPTRIKFNGKRTENYVEQIKYNIAK